MMKKILLALAAGIVLLSCSLTKVKTGHLSQKQPLAKADTTKADTTKRTVKAYKEVITDKAITEHGLIKAHRIDSRYYFEIADSILNQDILIVNRISKASDGVRPSNGMLGYAGDYIGENVVRFEKGPDHKLFIKRVSYLDLSQDSSENGMYRSVYNSTFSPIVAMFDIKAYSPDSSSSVIDISDFIMGDNDILFFNPNVKRQFGLSAFQADKSYIGAIKSFPLNTEIKTVKTYLAGENVLTYELNSSMVLLPANPMKTRSFDQRVGYFARGFRDFDFPQAAKPSFIITRWRLEPKEEDVEKYKMGELVEPKKPIVFYIDPATPKKWVPYLIEGVNAWQKAFEKAGFKNAIYALEAPINDLTWSLEDARHNVIVYKPSFAQNATGPQVSDPRSGEILESHINWYHNIQQLLHDWYFIQASPIDPEARKMEFNDSLMGKLISYVCTHEVGHTLGLQHNFISSSSIPVDSLRSRKYVAKNGFCPSIMDYARFNYVAQPEDSIAVNDLIPRIGIYDEWAIEWGYKWLPDITTGNEEKAFMNKWILQRLSKDERLVFSMERGNDYRSQMEDLGDNAVKASYYGIKNLQRVMKHLKEWTSMPNSDYKNLGAMQNALISQYNRYINHVSLYIGGTNVIPKTIEQKGPVLIFASRKQQQAAVKFLHDHFFDNTQWLSNNELTPLTGKGPVLMMYNLQIRLLLRLVSAEVCNDLRDNDSYSFDEYLTDMETGIWKELTSYSDIGIYRRTVQKIYVSKLIDFIRLNRTGTFGVLDGYTIVSDHINRLYEKIGRALKYYNDAPSLSHLKDLHNRLRAVIEYQQKYIGEPPINVSVTPQRNFTSEKFEISPNLFNPISYLHKRGCWLADNGLEDDNF